MNTTGDPGGPQTGQFILNQLGGDADNDGVFDSFDNCPPSRCVVRGLDASRCANADQSDPDGDGIGDVCDNCAQSVCDGYHPLPLGITCKNPAQADHDGDGRGDMCDLCPDTSEAIFSDVRQPDADGDGVGDSCDGCALSTPFHVCSSDADCPGRFGSFCVSDPGSTATPHCADLADADQDSVPDACDNCPGFASVDVGNANGLSEGRERLVNASVAILGDACDPVPLVRLPPQQGSIVTAFPTPGDGMGPDDQIVLTSNRWVGVDSSAPALRLTGSRRFTYRHCTCVDPLSGATLDLSQCVGIRTTCDWAAPDQSPTTWRRITIQDAMGANVLGTDGWSAPAAFTTNSSFNGNVVWPWRGDVLAGRVTGLGTCPGTKADDCKTHGAIFTRVQQALPTFSNRDTAFNVRDGFTLYDTPNFQFAPSVPPTFGLPSLAGCPNCKFRWIIPDVGDPFPVSIFKNIDRPSPVLFVNNRLTAVIRPDLAIDPTALFTPAALDTIGSAATWLGPVEPRGVLRTRLATNVNDSIPAVFLPNALTAGDSPTYITATSATMDSFNPAKAIALELHLTTPSAIAAVIGGPTFQSGVRGVYSALDSSVYVVGGSAANGRPAGTIWRWSITNQHWQPVLTKTTHAPASLVLGVAYDALRQRLYVLDVSDETGPLTRYVRLVRYELATGSSVETLVLPYSALHIVVSLSTLEDGTVTLVAADPLSYAAWRMDASGPIATFLGVKLGIGTVLAAPAMGQDRLYLPVLRGTQIVLDDLPATGFLPGASCSGL